MNRLWLCVLAAIWVSYCAQGAEDTIANKNSCRKNIHGEIEIKKGEEKAFFKTASEYVKHDSLIPALSIYRILSYTDRPAGCRRKATVLYDKTEKLALAKVQNRLQGNWRWIWSGSNWGIENRPADCDCSQMITINKNSITFYQNDTLIRTTTFRLFKDFGWRTQKDYNEISIELNDKSEKWHILFDGTWWTPEDGFTINKYYGCVCGCPEEGYAPVY